MSKNGCNSNRKHGFTQQYLIKCCYWYYVKCDPLISDQEYDLKFKQLEKMEKGIKFIDPKSPTQRIYGDRDGQYPDWVKDDRHLNWGD